MIRVLLADDQKLIRAGFRVLAQFPLDSPGAPAAEATPATADASTTQKAGR